MNIEAETISFLVGSCVYPSSTRAIERRVWIEPWCIGFSFAVFLCSKYGWSAAFLKHGFCDPRLDRRTGE